MLSASSLPPCRSTRFTVPVGLLLACSFVFPAARPGLCQGLQGTPLTGTDAQGLAGALQPVSTAPQQPAAPPEKAPATPATLAGQTPAQPAAPPAVQTQPPAAAPDIQWRIRPTFPTDPQRLRRTPSIDGVLQDGEWDPFYTINTGPVQGTVYCNWDQNYLYVATRTDHPATVVVDVDGSDDGWLRGADNLEIVVGSAGANSAPSLDARLLDATSSKDAPFWSSKTLDLKTIEVAEQVTNGTQVMEMGIPKDMASLLLRPGSSVGLRVEFLPPGAASAYAPTEPYEPHLLLDANLVDAHVEAASGINPSLTLSDTTPIAGEKLYATLDLSNQMDVPIAVRSVTWAGDAASTNALDLLKQVAVPPVPASGRLKLGYRSILPADLVPGSYTLVATTQLANGKVAQCSAAFNLVEPIHPTLNVDPNPVVVVGNTRVTVNLSVFSEVPDHWRGDLEITRYPRGWVLDGGARRSVAVFGKGATSVTPIFFHLPASTGPGDYPVETRISWRGRTWDLRALVHVQANEAAPAGGK